MASNPTRSLRISLTDFQAVSAEISVVLVVVVEGILKMKLALAPLTPTRSMDIALYIYITQKKNSNGKHIQNFNYH